MEDKKKHKIIWPWVVICLESIFLVLLTFQKISETKEKLNVTLQLKNSSQELSAKDSQVKELQKQIEDLEKTRKTQEEQVRELITTQKILEAKMEGAKEATEMLAKQVQLQNEDTFSQIKNLASENRKAELTLIAKIRSLIEIKHDLEKRLSETKAATQEEPSVKETPKTAEIPLGKINVQRKPSEPSPPSLEGTVLSVDNRYNFVIIDLGKEKNIKPKDKFFVMRKETKISEIEIKEIYDNMSLADIIPSKTIKDIRKYDRIVPTATYQ
jgi:hypothetical protein